VKNPYLISTKVYLRPLEREDAPVVAAWFNDPEIRRMIRRQQPINLLAEEDYIAKANQSEHDLVLGIAVKETDRLIGAAGLHGIDFKNRHAMFGISIGVKEEWGRGYGTAATVLVLQHAFETLNLNRIWLHVYEDNDRGIKVYEKIGFQKEGVLRQDNYRDGRYWNTITMAMLREEWMAKK